MTPAEWFGVGLALVLAVGLPLAFHALVELDDRYFLDDEDHEA